MIDRTGNLEHFFNVHVTDPYHYRHYDKSWADTSLAVAKKICDKYSGSILLRWSGGIDSTNALVSLLQTTDHKRLVVNLDEDSIAEFPEFYENIIKDRLTVCWKDRWLDKQYDEEICVTGSCGDSVWAVIDQSSHKRFGEHWHRPWQDWVKEQPNGHIVDVDYIEKFNSWSGTQIRTLLDLRAWFYLNLKWQAKKMECYHWNPHVLTNKNLVAFYSFDDTFSLWTMNNLDLLVQGPAFGDIKMPAKKFINDFFPCDRYLKNKTKVDSGVDLSSIDDARDQKRNISLRTGSTYRAIMRLIRQGYSSPIAVDDQYRYHCLPSMPLFDLKEWQDWNDQNGLLTSSVIDSLKSYY